MTRPRTGEKRKTNQPLTLDRMPPSVHDSILVLRNVKGKTWDEISQLSAEPLDRGGFVNWPDLEAPVLRLFPKRMIPRTTLHRWYDLRVDQVRADVLARSEQARVIADAFAKSMPKNGGVAVMNAARDTILSVLAEDSSTTGRKSAARALISLAEVMQAVRTNDIRERKVHTEERKIRLLEERERALREKLERETRQLERKHSKGELKREDIAKLVEMTFGIAPKAA